ncbi:unnamed protein product [Sphagnum balticum]
MSLLASTSSAYATGGMTLEGINISGAEFTPSAVPGVLGTNYIYPNTTELDYFSSKGMTVIRVPFCWERMQQSANGPLDPYQLSLMDATISAANARGLAVILDPHNYGAYQNVTIGVPGGQPNSMFADFWSKMATHYAGNPKVIFGLMNEPVGSSMTSATWEVSAQAAVNAIRAAGAANLILVPSTYWEHPVNFLSVNAADMIKITDPGNNWSYEVHQYLDSDGSGTHPDFLSVSDSVATLSSFTAWCQANNKTAFLGEIGVTADPGACADLSAMLQYMHANPNVWTGFTFWVSGQWYPANQLFLIQPTTGTDVPQMQTIIANLANTTPTSPTKPTTPKTPIAPTTPTTPTKPTTPTTPTKPTKPTTPTKPSKPAKPPKPAKPTKPAKPPKPAKPTKPAKPPKPAKPSKPAKPPKPAKPTKPTEPKK